MSWLQTPLLRERIHDDRGARVPLWSSTKNAKSDDPAERALAERAAQLSASDRARMFLAVWLITVTLIIISMLLGAPPLAIPIIIVVVFALGITWSTRRHSRLVRPAIRLTLLSDCRCASCGYDLLGVPDDPDGCTTCPECHGAWRIAPEMIHARRTRDQLLKPAAAPDEIQSDRASRAWLQQTLTALNWRPRYSTRDARGRVVGLIDCGLFWQRPARWEEVPPEERRGLRQRLYLVGWPWRLVFLLLVFPFILYLAWIKVNNPGIFARSPIRIFEAFFFGVYLPVILLGAALNPGAGRRNSIVRIMLRQGHCPSCAARLLAPPEDSDRQVTCPACAAAWDPRQARFRPVEPTTELPAR